jgi:hypothetical protein
VSAHEQRAASAALVIRPAHPASHSRALPKAGKRPRRWRLVGCLHARSRSSSISQLQRMLLARQRSQPISHRRRPQGAACSSSAQRKEAAAGNPAFMLGLRRTAPAGGGHLVPA